MTKVAEVATAVSILSLLAVSAVYCFGAGVAHWMALMGNPGAEPDVAVSFAGVLGGLVTGALAMAGYNTLKRSRK